MKKFGWILFVFFSITVGLYPIVSAALQVHFGLFHSKTAELLNSGLWNWAFYQHILLGGIALLTGWSQFRQSIRVKNMNLHRTLGKVYVVACLLSGIAGLYLSFYATGGLVAQAGFNGLAIGWLLSTGIAYNRIQSRKIDNHQAWMIRSYALTWAAVTLRIYLPLSQVAGMEFIEAYRIIAWLCWVPNLLVAEWIIARKNLPSLLPRNVIVL